jgi:hypothetical protein
MDEKKEGNEGNEGMTREERRSVRTMTEFEIVQR